MVSRPHTHQLPFHHLSANERHRLSCPTRRRLTTGQRNGCVAAPAYPSKPPHPDGAARTTTVQAPLPIALSGKPYGLCGSARHWQLPSA